MILPIIEAVSCKGPITKSKKYAIVYDGKLLKEFEKLCKALHIAGYYRGLLEDVTMVKDALRAAKSFIDKCR